MQILPIVSGDLLHICDSLLCKRWHFPTFERTILVFQLVSRMRCEQLNGFFQIMQLLPKLFGDLLRICDSLSCKRWHFPTFERTILVFQLVSRMRCKQLDGFFKSCNYFQYYLRIFPLLSKLYLRINILYCLATHYFTNYNFQQIALGHSFQKLNNGYVHCKGKTKPFEFPNLHITL